MQFRRKVSIIYTGRKVPKWFRDNRAQHGLDTVQLSLSSSHNLLGFVFCLVSESDAYQLDLSVRDEGGEMIHDAVFPTHQLIFHTPINFGSSQGNVFLFSRPELSKSVLENIKGKRKNYGATTYNPTISFKFCEESEPMRESGVYPIYASQYSDFKVYSRKRKTRPYND